MPPEQNAAFVCAMEDVLDVYERPVNARFPVICFDEKPCQLIRDVLQPVQAAPGRLQRQDSEYERCGTANVFGWVEPLTGRRDAWVTARRTSIDDAHALKRVSEAYPDAVQIVLVQDNLSTHSKAALYHAFPAPEARRLAARFDFHFTPRHGSWLNMQELEFSALARQALQERVGDQAALESTVAHWIGRRTTAAIPIRWQFTTPDARIKLCRLYPKMIG
ncbi:IS630 family transposase [Deinococcus aquatilis]|uniref:IS630 family transposase n=1 Tax=Deinococcus aquatilis TaxID=519440 RepID=UPI001FE0A6D8|nr:IS630 family transposase [Deinococcus aquatilis]